jgi:PKD repeat protein
MAAGVSVVTSAGNSNTTTAGFLESKAGVINVASTTSNDTKSGFSSYGVEVEVSAPGSSIYNTYSNHGSPSYAWLGGTSMASPHVTGLIGLVRAYNPELEKHKVDSVVIATADNIDAQNPAYIGLLGSGRINARQALEGTPFADFDVDITFGQAPLAVQYTDHSYLNPTAWDWDLGNGDTSTDTNTATVYTAPGKYTVSLTTQCDAGSKTTTKPDLVYTVVDSVGGLAGEGIVNHGGSVSLSVALTVEVDSLIIPFTTTGISAITIDSITQTDPWAGLFPLVTLEDFVPGTGTGVLRYKSDTGAVTVETGTIATFHFSVAPATPGDELHIVPDSGFMFYTPYGTYEPEALSTIARVAAFPQGDVTQDGFITAHDAIVLVNYVFKSGVLPDPDLGKVNGDEVVDAGDLIYLVNYLFKGGPAPIG